MLYLLAEENALYMPVIYMRVSNLVEVSRLNVVNVTL